MRLVKGQFQPHDLQLFQRALLPDAPPLAVGDHCRLLSGGPLLLVVDVEEEVVAVAWPDRKGSSTEATMPRAIVRRCGGREIGRASFEWE